MAKGKKPTEVGWYVYDENDKCVGGPFGEVQANTLAKKLGGDKAGITVGYTSDYDARRANEGLILGQNGFLIESPEIQALGKSLKDKPVEEVSAVEKDELDLSKVDSSVEEKPPVEEKLPVFKLGDIVIPKPLKGPHAGEEHEIIKIHSDGRLDIKPTAIAPDAVKYRNGGVTAKPDDVTLKESYQDNFKGFKLFSKGSLLTQVETLAEDIDSKKKKWIEAVKKEHLDLIPKLKFKSRIEKGVHTTSAEIGDRSYGVFDDGTGEGKVFKIDEAKK